MTLPETAGAPRVRIERRIAASPAAVYAAWTEPELMQQWMSPFGHAEVEADARVGGALQVAMVEAGTRIEHTGEFLALDAPRRVQFTWISPYTGAVPSVVTVEFAPEGAGTRLVLTHELLPPKVVESHAGGWDAMVDRLARVLANRAASDAGGSLQ